MMDYSILILNLCEFERLQSSTPTDSKVQVPGRLAMLVASDGSSLSYQCLAERSAVVAQGWAIVVCSMSWQLACIARHGNSRSSPVISSLITFRHHIFWNDYTTHEGTGSALRFVEAFVRWEFYRESRCLATCTEASLSKHMNLRNRQRLERHRKVMSIRLCVSKVRKRPMRHWIHVHFRGCDWYVLYVAASRLGVPLASCPSKAYS